MKRFVAGAVLITGCLLTVVTGLAFRRLAIPLFPLPAPTGLYVVGTTRIALRRDLAVRLWYPAVQHAGGHRAVYRSDELGDTLRERMTRSLVRTHSLVDVPVEPKMHPLLIYVPAWGGQRSDNTAQAENLASNGFVVAAMDDRYPAPGMDLSSESAYRNTVRWANRKVQLQSAAVSDVLTLLERSRLAGPADAVQAWTDFGRIGIFGYSFGGAVAAETTIHDQRFRAAVNLDGWTFGDAAIQGVSRPFLIIGTGAPTLSGTRADEYREFAQLNAYETRLDRLNSEQITDGFRRNGGYYVEIDGTRHESFCDDALLPRFRRPPAGSIDSRRAQAIVATLLTEFFNSYLNGTAAPFLQHFANGGPAPSHRKLDSAAHGEMWKMTSG